MRYPMSDIRKEFDKKYNLAPTDIESLVEELKPLRIERRVYAEGSHNRRDYWTFALKRIYPGKPYQPSTVNSSESEVKVDLLKKKVDTWLKNKSINTILPIARPYYWTYEVEHESKEIEIGGNHNNKSAFNPRNNVSGDNSELVD
ncbi:hypothetical protein SAMD00019534_059700 [Acytostelium subglobosum LB1]|uniref:hypothetical protein n=1 Tax=Acytostelium subglobosum LB1 TaxID=1410327 RepID=UPI000644BB19|nr:hypothetical protein SAMD00019534_059700 [Acytostelium subglobosum LB1]GAM22795.1 hypothetical protein SAMD00019534_059700 [Acytostelium subglobosum LB1]|eukprot:XP_012754022.1 hypothetical protein SAMD00019534_059700 [Acytostelium subglobosum LB1]